MERTQVRVSDGERADLERLIRGRNTPQKVVLRANIVVLTADGVPTSEIMGRLKTTCPTITRWRSRYAEQGVEGLCKDATRPGRKPRINDEQVREVIERTLHSTPVNGTHWSTRTMAAATGLSKATIQRLWSAHGLQPHRTETFKLSRDPQFLAKLEDVVGHYLDPPEKAIVFSVDEKSQIQALDRTQPGLPMKKGRAGTMTHDYKRNGTTTLFAALNVATGEVVGACYERHRHDEFLVFLKKLDRQTPRELALHLIVDNYATHKHPAVQAWLTNHERVHLHFTPTSASWLNLVERFFAEITQNRIRRGVFKSVGELEAAIAAYLAHRNQQPRRGRSVRWSLASVGVALLLATLAAACDDNQESPVALTVQGLFQAEVPAGWQLSIPQNFETDGPPPVLAAGPKGGDSGLAVFAPSATDPAAALAELTPRIGARLGEPAAERANGQQRVRATGAYVDREGNAFDVVVVGVRPDGASKAVVVFCQLSELTQSDCDQFIDSLRAA